MLIEPGSGSESRVKLAAAWTSAGAACGCATKMWRWIRESAGEVRRLVLKWCARIAGNTSSAHIPSSAAAMAGVRINPAGRPFDAFGISRILENSVDDAQTQARNFHHETGRAVRRLADAVVFRGFQPHRLFECSRPAGSERFQHRAIRVAI